MRSTLENTTSCFRTNKNLTLWANFVTAKQHFSLSRVFKLKPTAAVHSKTHIYIFNKPEFKKAHILIFLWLHGATFTARVSPAKTLTALCCERKAMWCHTKKERKDDHQWRFIKVSYAIPAAFLVPLLFYLLFVFCSIRECYWSVPLLCSSLRKEVFKTFIVQ